MKPYLTYGKRYYSRAQVRDHIIAQMNKVEGFKWPSLHKVKEIHIQQRLTFGMACKAHDEGKFELSKQNDHPAQTAAKRLFSQLTDVEGSVVTQSKQKKIGKLVAKGFVQSTDVEDDSDDEDNAPTQHVRKPAAGQPSVAQSKQKRRWEFHGQTVGYCLREIYRLYL